MTLAAIFAFFLSGMARRPWNTGLDLVQEFHRHYNTANTAGMSALTGSPKGSARWISKFSAWRENHGAFLRSEWSGYSFHTLSWSKYGVDIWTVSQFERGRRQERFQMEAMWFGPLRILGVSIVEMQPPDPLPRSSG